jgi:DNA-binding Lrp family transcriptional regulator
MRNTKEEIFKRIEFLNGRDAAEYPNIADIADGLGITPAHFYNLVKELIEEGRVSREIKIYDAEVVRIKKKRKVVYTVN